MNHDLDRTAFAGRRIATLVDLRRVLDMLIMHFKERDERNLTITVVDTLAELPENARATDWYRVVADPSAVYVGNGLTRPLSRFTTTPL